MAINFDRAPLKRLATNQAFDDAPSSFVAAPMMVAGVILDGDEFKIFKSVVRLDAISVVNVFA